MSSLSSIVITGAAGCLGRVIATASLHRGWRVVISTRRPECPLPPHPEMLHVGGVDLANTQAGARLAHATRDHLAGRAFAVANCVGSFPGYRGITEIDGNSAASVLRDNLLAVYNTAHALLPLMRDAGGGHFVAFTSHSRYQAYPLMAAFDAAKAGVVQLVRHIANEEARHRVFANALALATLLTDAERRMKPHGDHAAWLRPEQVAEALFWLVGAPASAVNGNELHLFNYSESYFHASYFDRINGHGSLNDGASG